MLSEKEIVALKGQRKVSMITAYDACFARIAEEAGIDMILVGDSGANVVLGHKSTRDIGMNEMLMFVGAVRRGAPNTHVVADMPWQSDRTPEEALIHAKRFLELGADSVKVEGCRPEVIQHLIQKNISVVGHLGLLPQTATSFKQQGREPEDALRIESEAKILAQCGVYALVLEHIPESLGGLISKGLDDVCVIGIGAGNQVDGQVLVLHDALGMHPFKIPPFAHRYADIFTQAVGGLRAYRDAIGS